MVVLSYELFTDRFAGTQEQLRQLRDQEFDIIS